MASTTLIPTSSYPFRLKHYIHPYQRRFIADQSRFRIWVAARQVGKTTTVALDATEACLTKSNNSVILVSASQPQSNELIDRVKFWVRVMEAALGQDLTVRENMSEVVFLNGNRIKALPANPRTIRGYTANVVLDEFAQLHGRLSRKIWAAASYIASKGGYRITITSTPLGKSNIFYDMWLKDTWSKHHTDIYQAVAEGHDVDIDSLKSINPDPLIWSQEFECQFIDEAHALLPYDLITSAVDNDAGNPQLSTGGEYYVGVDVGRRHDLTVIWVLESLSRGGVLATRSITTLRDTPFPQQRKVLESTIRRFDPVRVCIDQTGLGEGLVDDMVQLFGSTIEGVTFTNKSKSSMAMGLRRVFDEKRITIPNDRDVFTDLHSIAKTTTSAGNIRFDAERNEDGHADRFWALALSVHATDNAAPNPVVDTAQPRSMYRELAGY